MLDLGHELFMPGQDFGGVEHCAGPVCCGVVLRVVFGAGTPFVDVCAQGVPVGVAACREGLADASIAVADADRVFFAHGVRELSKAAVFLGDDEVLGHHSSSS
ncbi:hypothetical protein RHRU231_620012 [Rhodococcus ruber]|uniref:Uncharacterized protein n=1 Tax=Rhodococcus ruber TaxID=1830 RepID=A0A098BQW9_9NOCA|nr:hypothetical protein RHRU231_620012 [Rhodococcus ruber]